MKHKSLSLVKPSTLEFYKEGRRTPGYSLFDWLHGYIYSRWPYLYIGMATGEHPLAKKYGWFLLRLVRWLPFWSHSKKLSKGANTQADQVTSQDRYSSSQVSFADTYHGKVVPLATAKQLVVIREDISLIDLEKIIPYARARDIILRHPDHIAVLECPCRSARSNPCLPLDVCLIVGEPFASFVTEHHPHRSRWIDSGEAIGILQAEDARGHVHHAFFKDAMLDRFYAICNCCTCCCGAMQAHQRGTPMLASSGYIARVDKQRCRACGTCTQFCQFGALSLNGHAMVDSGRCMGCGLCVSKCRQSALSLQRAPDRGEPLEIRELLAAVSRQETVL